MPNFNPKHNAPNLRKYVKKVMFNGKRALLMDRMDWEEAIKGKSGVFEIDERITPMSNVSQDNLIVGCLVEKLVNGDYSLDIYRYDPKDDKPINIDRHLVYPYFNLRDDFEEIVKHASTDNDENMKGFFDECVIIQIKPKNNHHIELDDLPVLLNWKVSEG